MTNFGIVQPSSIDTEASALWFFVLRTGRGKNRKKKKTSTEKQNGEVI